MKFEEISKTASPIQNPDDIKVMSNTITVQ